MTKNINNKYRETKSFSSKVKKLFISTVHHKYFNYVRDIIILAIVLIGVMAWQSKDMLSVDGNTIVKQRNLVTLNGKVSPLLSDTKPNLIYFFAPWCTICDFSIDNLSYLNSEKVNVVVVALDYKSIEEVSEFVQKNNVSAPIFLGDESMKEEFLIRGYPSYYMLNENNEVVSRSYGYSTAVGLKLREMFGS